VRGNPFDRIELLELVALMGRRPVEVWAAEEKGLVTWLTRRLGFPVHAPDLNSVGYALSGNVDRAQLLSVARVVYGQLAALEAAPNK
jgi:anti-sigma factor RsiW